MATEKIVSTARATLAPARKNRHCLLIAKSIALVKKEGNIWRAMRQGN